MAKIKKKNEVTYDAIERALGIEKSDSDNVVNVMIGEGENSIVVPIKQRLTLAERSDMIESIALMVFAGADEKDGAYSPYFKQFATDVNIINYFTDIKLPKKTDDICKFIEKTRIVDKIMSNTPYEYINTIIYEAQEFIEYKKAINIKRTKFDVLIESAVELLGLIKTKMESIDSAELIDVIQKNVPEFKEKILSGNMLKMFEANTISK